MFVVKATISKTSEETFVFNFRCGSVLNNTSIFLETERAVQE